MLRCAFSGLEIREGAPIIHDEAPTPTVHARVITEDFVSRDSHAINYKKYMGGQLIRESTNNSGVRFANIFIAGATEFGPDDGQAWVPYDKTRVYPCWKDNL
jgi:hypothetical protein